MAEVLPDITADLEAYGALTRAEEQLKTADTAIREAFTQMKGHTPMHSREQLNHALGYIENVLMHVHDRRVRTEKALARGLGMPVARRG